MDVSKSENPPKPEQENPDRRLSVVNHPEDEDRMFTVSKIRFTDIPEEVRGKEDRQFYVKVKYGKQFQVQTPQNRAVEWHPKWKALYDSTVDTDILLTLSVFAVRHGLSNTAVGSYDGKILFKDLDFPGGEGVFDLALHVVNNKYVRFSEGAKSFLSVSLHPSPLSLSQVGREVDGAVASVGGLVEAPLVVSTATEFSQHVSDAGESMKELYDTLEPLLKNIAFVVDVVDKIAEIHPYAKMAWSVISIVIIRQSALDEDMRRLMQCLEQAFIDLRAAGDLDALRSDDIQASIIARMFRQTYECGLFIQEYAKDTPFWKRLVKNSVTNQTKVVQQYIDAFDELKTAFINRTAVTTKIVTLQVAEDVQGLAEQLEAHDARDLLDKEVPYATGVWYDSDGKSGCLPGTRARFLDAIADWVNDPSSPPFFFKRSSVLEPHLLITTLVRDLAQFNPVFKQALVKILRDDSQQLRTKNCTTLLTRLLVDPLKNLHLLGPIVVVVDALDECGDDAAYSSLASALALAASQLPLAFRLLITSRPEKFFGDTFASHDSVRVLRLDNPTLAADVRSDIRMFIRNALPHPSHGRFSEEEYDDLTEAAGDVFQWASAACSAPPTYRAQRPLDDLYKSILTQTFPDILEDQAVCDNFRLVLGYMLASYEPPSQKTLIGLIAASLPPDDKAGAESIAHAILDHLDSLLLNVHDDEKPISPLHTSFREFLIDPARNHSFSIDLREAHRRLARSCLLRMYSDLRFNICHLETSFKRNQDIPDLDTRILQCIPSCLHYACLYWDGHLGQTRFNPDMYILVQTLFQEKFLFWLEALSLMRNIPLVVPALASLKTWLQPCSVNFENISSQPDTFLTLLDDALRFLRYFAMPISQSTPPAV
ncbi:hypothetical protein K488DRAFT_92471 [Vararia minispora EC-137]|uniref:Uncharacterized protein n=1 Tax=Vararia minispora EC-137 TaxID=1314806 RepID=A0ACB8Q4F8_9AGAM|nr:hypothetical protein K488DRAFT_92471 [Vararia minispora EC-137]